MIDPLQMLMQQAADSVSLFAENSRYRNIEAATGALPNGQPVRYLRRRFVPKPDEIGTLAEHVVRPIDRLDNLANQYLGDPELYRRICDANYEARPDDVTDDPPETGAPRVIRIGLPPGVPAPGQS